MCFKNLPIEFDADGKAKLRETAGDPYGNAETPVRQFVTASTSSDHAGSAASTTPPRLRGWGMN